MPDGLVTFFTAMTPIGELRASIPLGVVHYDLPWGWVLLLSIAGNLMPVPVRSLPRLGASRSWRILRALGDAW